MRAQANLPAVTVALVVLTATAGTALVLADGAFAGATREGDERRVAVALAERMVAPGAPTTRRANVLNGSALAVLDGERLREWFPVARGVDVGVRLGDRTVVDGDGGTVARRVVLVADAQSVTRTPRWPAARRRSHGGPSGFGSTSTRRQERRSRRCGPTTGSSSTTPPGWTGRTRSRPAASTR